MLLPVAKDFRGPWLNHKRAEMDLGVAVPTMRPLAAQPGQRTPEMQRDFVDRARAALQNPGTCTLVLTDADGASSVLTSYDNGATLTGSVPPGKPCPAAALKDAEFTSRACTIVGDVSDGEFAGQMLVTFDREGADVAAADDAAEPGDHPGPWTYAGGAVLGFPHGAGELTGPGIALEGQWRGGRPHGHCLVRFASPEVVAAAWIDDLTGQEPDPGAAAEVAELASEEAAEATARAARQRAAHAAVERARRAAEAAVEASDRATELIASRAARRLAPLPAPPDGWWNATGDERVRHAPDDPVEVDRMSPPRARPRLQLAQCIAARVAQQLELPPDSPDVPGAVLTAVPVPEEEPPADPEARVAACRAQMGEFAYAYEGAMTHGAFAGRGVLVTPTYAYVGLFRAGRPDGDGVAFASRTAPAAYDVVYRNGQLVSRDAKVEAELAAARAELAGLKARYRADGSMCKVCFDAAASMLLMPCRHLLTCRACYTRSPRTCPVCRARVSEAVEVLRS